MTSFEKFLLLYDICLPPMLTGVPGGHFYIVSAGISFYICIVGFCFWLYVVFISALLLRGILHDFSYTCMAHCLIFPFSFFFCLSASSILLSFVTICCYGCSLSNKKLRRGRVVMSGFPSIEL
jgi:hypothetical protein